MCGTRWNTLGFKRDVFYFRAYVVSAGLTRLEPVGAGWSWLELGLFKHQAGFVLSGCILVCRHAHG